MNLTKKQISFLKQLADLGAMFHVFGSDFSGGFLNLDVEELAEYVKDTELWREKLGAEQAGVTLQQ